MSTPTWYDVLGVDPDASSAEIRAAWRDGIADLSPGDRRFRSLNQAAEVLLDEKTKSDYDAARRTADLTDAGAVEQDATATDSTPAPLTRRKKIGGAKRGRFFPDGSAHEERKPKPETTTDPQRGSQRNRGTKTDPTPELDPDTDTTKASTAKTSTTTKTSTVTRTGPPTWLLMPLAILTALLVAVAAFLLTQPSDAAVATSTDDAQGAAEQAATTILGYDYRRLDADQKAADALMTPSFAEKYDALFATIKQNAPSIKPVVTPQVLASGIVRSGGDRVEVLVFVNQTTTRGDGSQVINHNQARFTMVKSGDQWLVGDLQTGSAAS